MATLALLIVGALVLAVIFAGRDKPTELDADVWADDPETRAQNLKLKIVARRAGKFYMSLAAAAKIEADCAARARPFNAGDFKISNPSAEEPERRLVRHHPMRAPRWE